MMRILALDYGRKRVGVALTDPLGITAQPQNFLPMRKTILEDIKQLIEEKSVKAIVLGLPLTMKGTDSEMTLEVRDFAIKLEAFTGLHVTLFDERLTSDSANKLLIEADVSRKKRKEVVDSIAAAILLQSYLEEHG